MIFIILGSACSNNKSLDSNFHNIEQILQCKDYTLAKSLYTKGPGDEEYYLELYDQENKLVQRFRGFNWHEGAFYLDSIKGNKIFITWTNSKEDSVIEPFYIKQFNEYKAKNSKLGKFEVIHNSTCFNNTGLGTDIEFDDFRIIDNCKIEFYLKNRSIANFKIFDLHFKPDLSVVEIKSNNYNLVGGENCNNSLISIPVKPTKKELLIDLKEKIKKLAIKLSLQ